MIDDITYWVDLALFIVAKDRELNNLLKRSPNGEGVNLTNEEVI